MNVFLGVMQFFFMIVIILEEYRRKSPAVFLWATLLVMFGITHLITTLIPSYDYSYQVQIEASSFVIMFMSFYYVTRFLTAHKLRHKEILMLNREQHDSKYFILLLFLGIAIGLKFYKYIQFAGNLFATSWGLGRDYSSTLKYFNGNQILFVIFYLSSGIFLYYLIKGNKLGVFLSASLITFQVVVTRNRIEVLPLLVGLITYFILKHRKLHTEEIFVLFLLGVMSIYLVYALRAFRHYGSIENFIDDFSVANFHERVITLFRTEDGELGLRRDFYYFLENHNNFKNFGKGHSYIRMMLVFIPTQWSFGIKPPDFAISMGAAIGMVSGGSTHPTLFGDCYANLGWWGILLGSFWALFASFFDKIIYRQKDYINKVLLFNLYAVSFIIMGRGSVYNGFVIMAYGTMLLLGWKKILLLLGNRK